MSNKVTITLGCAKKEDGFDEFENIYNLYWKKLYTICYHHLQDQDVAKDLVQDIFVSLWERQDELEINDSLEKYLVRAAKFKICEYIRKKVGRDAKIESLTYLQGQDQPVLSHELVECEELQNKINMAIAQLPAHCKNVFVKSRFKGLKNKEIAETLQVTERTVEYHITKALAQLRISLKEYAHLFSLLGLICSYYLFVSCDILSR